MLDTSKAGYPHAYHTRYVRGCEACLARSRAGARRLTESRQATARDRKERCGLRGHAWTLLADDTLVCEKCYHRDAL